MSDAFDDLTGSGLNEEDAAVITEIPEEEEDEVLDGETAVVDPLENDSEEKELSEEEEFYEDILAIQDEYGDGSQY